MTQIHTGGLLPGDAPTTLKTERAISGVLDATSAAAVTSIIHTTTPITITAIRCYSTLACTGGALKIDVGIDGDDNAIAAAAAIGVTAKDDVDTIAVGTAAVAAGHTITATINTVDGAAGEVQIAIEYIEKN